MEQAEAILRQRLTAGVSHTDFGTLIALAVAKYTVVDILEGREWDAFDDGGG